MVCVAIGFVCVGVCLFEALMTVIEKRWGRYKKGVVVIVFHAIKEKGQVENTGTSTVTA